MPAAKIALLILSLLGLGAVLYPVPPSSGGTPVTAAAAEAPAPQADALRFDPPTLDLGEMIAGQPKSATLTVTNIGNEPVTIASMKGGCGCTTLSAYPSDAIAIGASFSVEVTVDPGMRTGISLRKPVHVKLSDGRVQTMHVIGLVKTVIAVTPEQVEAVGSLGSAAARVTLASVDGAPFVLKGSTPAGLFVEQQPGVAASRFEIELDLEAWEQSGRPPTVMILTDRPDARQLAMPVKFADAVAMFRLPAAEVGRKSPAQAQDELVHELDSKIPASARSKQFRMRLHRESGMLFVHGTDEDLRAVRAAVQALPPSSGVRESVPTPKG